MSYIGVTPKLTSMDKASTIVLASSLIIIMLGMGLSLVVDDFKRILIYPKAILVGLVNQIIILPLIGLLIPPGWL